MNAMLLPLLTAAVIAADPLPPGAIARIGTADFRQPGVAFFTADGQTMISPDGHSGTVRWWDPLTGRTIHELTLPDAVFSESYFDAGSGMLTVSGRPGRRDFPSNIDQHKIWIVNATTRQLVRTVPMSVSKVGGFYRSGFAAAGKRFIGAADNELQVWDTRTGDELIRQNSRENIEAFAVAPDGTVAFGYRAIYVWRWQTAAAPEKLVGFDDMVRRIAFAPDGRLYIQPPGRGPVQVWDPANSRRVGTLDVGGRAGLSFSPDGKMVAVGYQAESPRQPREGTVTFWDVASSKELRSLSPGSGLCGFSGWSPEGRRFAVWAGMRRCIYDAETGARISRDDPGHTDIITALAFAPDGVLFTASDDYTVRSWDPMTGRRGLRLVQKDIVRGLAVSPDGRLVAGSALENDLRVWDAATGAERFKLRGNGELGGHRWLRFTADGRRLVAFGDDGCLRVWNTGDGKLFAATELRKPGDIYSPDPVSAISGDGALFALGSDPSADEPGVRMIDPLTGNERAKINLGDTTPELLTFSPDGTLLAVCGSANSIETKLPSGAIRHLPRKTHPVEVWNLAERKLIWRATVDGWMPACVHFTPDGKRLAETTYDETYDDKTPVRFWDAATGRPAGQIDLTLGGGRFAFDRRGRWLAIALADTTALVYDFEAAVKPPK